MLYVIVTFPLFFLTCFFGLFWYNLKYIYLSNMRKLLEEKPDVLTAIRIPEDTIDIAPSVLSHKEFTVMEEDLYRIQLQYVGDSYRIIWQSTILDVFTMCCIKGKFFFPSERIYRKLVKFIDSMDNEKLRSFSEKKKGVFYQFNF